MTTPSSVDTILLRRMLWTWPMSLDRQSAAAFLRCRHSLDYSACMQHRRHGRECVWHLRGRGGAGWLHWDRWRQLCWLQDGARNTAVASSVCQMCQAIRHAAGLARTSVEYVWTLSLPPASQLHPAESHGHVPSTACKSQACSVPRMLQLSCIDFQYSILQARRIADLKEFGFWSLPSEPGQRSRPVVSAPGASAAASAELDAPAAATDSSRRSTDGRSRSGEADAAAASSLAASGRAPGDASGGAGAANAWPQPLSRRQSSGAGGQATTPAAVLLPQDLGIAEDPFPASPLARYPLKPCCIHLRS